MTRVSGILLCVLVFVSACGGKQEREQPPLPVTVTVAAPDVISRTVQAPCRIEADREAVITVSVPARIEEVGVVEGDTVRSGEILIHLTSDDSYASSLNSAAAMVSAARAAADYSGQNLSRAASLFESGAMSSSGYDAAVTADEAARAALGRARAGYSQASAAGSAGLVTAPFDGRITRVWARAGNMASGPLLSMTGNGVLRAELLISQRHLQWLKEGAPAFFSTSHFPGDVFPGSVTSAVSSVDPVSGLVPLTVQLSDTSGKLVPGLSGIVTVSLETSRDAVVLPGRALIPTVSGTWEVALVKDGMVVIGEVETGIRQGNSWEITSGIQFGDSVIVLGNHLVDEGTQIVVVE